MKDITQNEEKMHEKVNANKKDKNHANKLVLACYVFLFTNLFLLASSYWFDYSQFYIPLGIASLVALIGMFVKKIAPIISIVLNVGFYGAFLYFNYNYVFVFAGSLILGVLILHFIKPHLQIPHYIYSFLPLLILAHIIWFNVLPFGFQGVWVLQVGEPGDDNVKADLYLIDENNVLTPTQTFGERSWREFRKTGSFEIGFNTPINLENKTVEIMLDYDAAGPIYINDQLFFHPSWGSSVNLGSFGDEFIYGADIFNLTIPYENVSLEEFLRITGNSSIEEFILKKYSINLAENDGNIEPLVDLWALREELKSEVNASAVVNSRFFAISDYSGNAVYVSDLLNETGLGIEDILKPTIIVFLENRGMTLQQFMDSELNNGPYPKVVPSNDNYATVEEYVRSNFPQGVPLKDFTGKYRVLENEMNSKYKASINDPLFYYGWSNEMKSLDASFRGDLKFYGVFSDTIELEIAKRDLNWYNGSDDVTILVKDYDDFVVANWTMEDLDGVVLRDTTFGNSNWTTFKFSQQLSKSGIYKFEIYHKNFNRHADFLIENITINTNKAMIDGQFLLWSPAKFYNVIQNNVMDVRYWWTGYEQKIFYSDGNFSELTLENKGSYVPINITKVDSVRFEKGFVYVVPEKNLAVWEDSYIDKDRLETIQITKSLELKKSNMEFFEIDRLWINSTPGTKIFALRLETK